MLYGSMGVAMNRLDASAVIGMMCSAKGNCPDIVRLEPNAPAFVPDFMMRVASGIIRAYGAGLFPYKL